MGKHHLINSLAAIGVVFHYNLDLKLALNELKYWKPRNGRGRFLDISFKKKLKKINIRIIDESYNCNPTSLYASFEILKSTKFDNRKMISRKIVILGDMLELGNTEKEFHKEIISNYNLKFFDLRSHKFLNL